MCRLIRPVYDKLSSFLNQRTSETFHSLLRIVLKHVVPFLHFNVPQCLIPSYPHISPSLPSLNRHGKTVFITGDSRGMGRAVFLNFIEAGANVFIVGRSEASLRKAANELDETAQARVGYEAADVSDHSAIKAAFMIAKEV